MTSKATPDPALAAAIRRVDPNASDAEVAILQSRYGWTAEMYTPLADLARWAIEHHAPIARASPEIAAYPLVEITGTLTIIRDQTAGRSGFDDGSDRTAIAWCAVVVGAPDLDAYRVLRNLLVSPAAAPTLQRDRWWPLGPAGALAYAAGLSPEEAAAWVRDHGVTPTVEACAELRALAALRGCRFPVIADETGTIASAPETTLGR